MKIFSKTLEQNESEKLFFFFVRTRAVQKERSGALKRMKYATDLIEICVYCRGTDLHFST